MNQFIGEFCIFRTYTAGVHFGTLVAMDGAAAIVRDSGRIWSWEKMFTLNAVAMDGVAPGSKVSKRVALILLTEVIEVIPCSEKSKACLLSLSNAS